MFGIFKSKKVDICSPADGELIDIENVNDEMFSQKMMGDGLALMPHDGIFRSPVDGKISKIFSTAHAFTVRHKSGLEVMVHIGIDTVELKGMGFEALVKEGEKVKAGDEIVRADLDMISSAGKDTVTPVIVTNMASYREIGKKSGSVKAADIVMEVE